MVCSVAMVYTRGTNYVVTHFLGFPVKYNYSALASYRIMPAALGSGLNQVLHLP